MATRPVVASWSEGRDRSSAHGLHQRARFICWHDGWLHMMLLSSLDDGGSSALSAYSAPTAPPTAPPTAAAARSRELLLFTGRQYRVPCPGCSTHRVWIDHQIAGCERGKRSTHRVLINHQIAGCERVDGPCLIWCPRARLEPRPRHHRLVPHARLVPRARLVPHVVRSLLWPLLSRQPDTRARA